MKDTGPRLVAVTHRWIARFSLRRTGQMTLGALATVASVALRFALAPLLGKSLPWVTFLPAIVASSVFGGTTAAITSMVLSALLGDLFFGHPTGWPHFGDLPLAARIIAFLGVGGALALLGLVLHRSLAKGRHQELRLREQVQDLERLHELGTQVIGQCDSTVLLRKVLETAISLQGCDRGVIDLYDPAQERFIPAVVLGHDEQILHSLPGHFVGEGKSACGAAAAPRERVIVEDTETDPRFAPYREAARAAGFRASWSTPLINSRGELLGMLSTHFAQPHRPSVRCIHLVELYARLATDAIEAALLYERAEHARRHAEQALAALRESDKRKDEFLAMLAHELRNPLAPICTAMSLLRGAGAERHGDRAREIITRQVVHLRRLIDDLLDVSRITHGKIRVERTRIALRELIEEAVETAQPLIDERKHRLWLTAPDSAVCVEADRARLVQAIANLLLNSAKFTPDGGQIWVDAGARDGRAWIRVRDTGAGIPQELQSSVFDLFVQEDATLARSRGGLGVGLTLVKRIAELHGGSVALHSAGRGQGCEATIELPALRSAADSAPPRAASAAPRAPLRVLIVEDNLDAAETFEMLLSAEGYRTRVVHDGATALRSLDEFAPDLAFLDLGLPDMDGFELARRLRRDPRTEKIVLAAVTGYGREEDKDQARAAGFDHHMTKPVQPEQILKLLAGFSA